MKSSNMFPHCLIFIKHLVTGWTSELIVNLKQNTIGILKELVTCPPPPLSKFHATLQDFL